MGFVCESREVDRVMQVRPSLAAQIIGDLQIFFPLEPPVSFPPKFTYEFTCCEGTLDDIWELYQHKMKSMSRIR
jgi:hypothetical protein